MSNEPSVVGWSIVSMGSTEFILFAILDGTSTGTDMSRFLENTARVSSIELSIISSH